MAWFRRRGTFESKLAYVVFDYAIIRDVKIHDVRTYDAISCDMRARDNWYGRDEIHFRMPENH